MMIVYRYYKIVNILLQFRKLKGKIVENFLKFHEVGLRGKKILQFFVIFHLL